MKILQIGKYYPPARGGMETHIEQLCQLLKDDVDLEVIVANHEEGAKRERIRGVSVRRLRTPLTIAGAPICPELPRAIREAEADIVHIHAPHPSAFLAYLASGASSQLVTTFHSDIVRQKVLGKLLKPLQEAAFRRANAIIGSSPNLLAGSQVLSNHRDRCVVVPFGIRCSLYESINEQRVSEIRRKYRQPIVLAIGRLVYYKGFEFLIRAMAQLRSDAVLLIIGEGPLHEPLKAEIQALGLSERVHLLGNVADIIPYYHACDLFVLPSVARSEAFGLVQLEAMACGKPVINTSIAGSGVPYVSLHGETGLTVAPADVPALEGAISRLLNDEPLRVQLGRAARQRVQDKFTLREMGEQTLAVYRRVSTGGPSFASDANPAYGSQEI